MKEIPTWYNDTTTRHNMDRDIRKKIRDYLSIAETPTKHTMICFVGMIETGEATPSDFAAVGGNELAKKVTDLWWHE